MTTVTVDAAKTQLDSLLRRVAAGEEIEIVDERKAIARIVPAAEPKVDWSETFKRLDEIWGGKSAPGKPGSEIVKEGRR